MFEMRPVRRLWMKIPFKVGNMSLFFYTATDILLLALPHTIGNMDASATTLGADTVGESHVDLHLKDITDLYVVPPHLPLNFERLFQSHTDIMTLVYNELSLTSLMALLFTQKQLFLDIADYQALKISRLLLPFNIRYDHLLSVLQTSGAIIVGSFALLCSVPLTSAFAVTSIDFAIADSKNHLDFLKSVAPLVSLTPKPKSLGPFPPNHPVKSTYSFAIALNGQELALDLNVMVVGWHLEGSSVYETLFYSPTSCGMNALSGDGIFCAYRHLLASSIGLVNDVHRSSIFQRCRNQDITYQLSYNNVSRHKYESRGFCFPNPHFLHQPSARCEQDLSCPSTIRNVRDRGCANMRIFSNTEIKNLSHYFYMHAGAFFDVSSPLIPFTVWRLSDPVLNSANPSMTSDIVCTFL